MKDTVLAWGIVISSVATVTQAADDFLLGGSGLDSELPVVLSATRLRQAVPDAPASITVIDRAMIAQSGARELPEILRLVPGMVVGYDTGWEPFVSYHGTSADKSRRMQVLVDGRSIYQPILAYVDWIGLPLELDDIDRIEVIRGPNAAAYGANSFLGVINIITRHPADVPALRAYTRTGGGGITDRYASASHSTNGVSWQVSTSSRMDEGYKYKLNRDTHQIVGDYPDDSKQKAVYGKLVWEMPNERTLTVTGGYASLRGQEDQNLDPTKGILSFQENPIDEITQQNFNMIFEQAFNNHHIQFQSDYSQYRKRSDYQVRTYPLLMLPELRQMFLRDRIFVDQGLLPVLESMVFKTKASDRALSIYQQGLSDPQMKALYDSFVAKAFSDKMMTKTLGYDSYIDDQESRLEAELQDTWTFNPNLRLVYGSGIQTSRSDSIHYFNGKVENTVWRAFAHGEWQFIPNWRLNLGAMDEHDDSAGHYFSPRIALNWRFAPTQSLRLVSSKAYRTPDLQEEKAYWQFYATTQDRSQSKYDGYHYYLGQALNGYQCIKSNSYPDSNYVVCNDKAPSEEIVSSELGYNGELPSAHLQADIRLYFDRLQMAEHNLEVNDFVIAPLQKHQQRGVEVASQWRPRPNWRFLLNYAYDDITGINDNTMFVPLHSGNVAAWYDDPSGIQASMTYVFYNQLFLNSTKKNEGLYYDQMVWRLAKKWSFHRQNDFELSGVWQIRLTEDPELRKENGSPRDRMWLTVSYAYD